MIAAKQPTGTRVTYEQWLKMPRTTQPHEVIDGEITMSPAPSSMHQWMLSELLDALRSHVRGAALGIVLPSPIDLIISKSPILRTRQPNILFLNGERTGVRGPKDLEDMPSIEVVPDLVVELLSPNEYRRTLAGKLEDYATLGVQEAWLVSHESETVEVLTLEDGEYCVFRRCRPCVSAMPTTRFGHVDHLFR
jgi:Uma2 family endonuclease